MSRVEHCYAVVDHSSLGWNGATVAVFMSEGEAQKYIGEHGENILWLVEKTRLITPE